MSSSTSALLPVTIAMIKKSQRMGENGDWAFEGCPYSKISLVAHLLSIDESATKLVYHLDDGTGRITADHWIGSAVEECWRDIQPNTYVSLIGSVHVYQDRKSINLAHMRTSPDPHELYYHLGQAMYANRQWHEQLAKSAVSVKNRSTELEKKIVDVVVAGQGDSSGLHVTDIVRSLGAEIATAIELEDALQNLMDNGHLYTTSDDSTFRATV